MAHRPGLYNHLLEPVGAGLIILGGLLALRFQKAGAVCGLIGAVLSVMALLWFLSYVYLFYAALGPSPSGTTSRIVFLDMLQVFGSGYWLAFIGCVLGLGG